MAEVLLNGVLEEEVNQYYHICFFMDHEEPNRDDPDCFLFVPKAVCRIIDELTVSVLDFYVSKKKLHPYIRGSRRVMYGRVKSKAGRKPPAASDWQKRKPVGRFRTPKE